MEHRFKNGRAPRLTTGDITKVPVDAMANAANSGLRGGGGVDGAIHRAGGPSILAELDEIRARIGHCPTGSARDAVFVLFDHAIYEAYAAAVASRIEGKLE